MTSIIRLALWLPAWFVLILAGGVFYAGTLFINLVDKENQELIAAAQLEPAQLVDFDPAATVSPGEVALRAKVFDDAAYRFYYGDDGDEDYVEYFWFMEAPDSTTTDREFSGVLVFDSESRAQVEAWWDSVLIDPENDNDLAAIRGFASESDMLFNEASEALYSLGGTATENFVFVRPFLDGRDAYYQGQMMPLEMIRYGLWLVVAVMLSWAVIRHVFGKRAKAAAATAVASSSTKTVSNVATAGVGVASLIYDDDEDDEEEGDFGLALTIGKMLFGFLWKRRAAKKTAQEAEQVAVDAPAIVNNAPQPMRTEQVMYKAHRQIYDEQGLPISL